MVAKDSDLAQASGVARRAAAGLVVAVVVELEECLRLQICLLQRLQLLHKGDRGVEGTEHLGGVTP